MKSVLISTRPKSVEKICHKIGEDETGKAIYEKRIEVRKSAPKEVPFKAYIYETKGQYVKFTHGAHTKYGYGRGKVIGEFVCDEIIKDERGENADLFTKQAGLSLDVQKDYGKNKPLYGWHISDLKIYDKPKELNEFRKHCKMTLPMCDRCEYYSIWCGRCENITRPPLSWCYVEDLGEEE